MFCRVGSALAALSAAIGIRFLGSSFFSLREKDDEDDVPASFYTPICPSGSVFLPTSPNNIISVEGDCVTACKMMNSCFFTPAVLFSPSKPMADLNIPECNHIEKNNIAQASSEFVEPELIGVSSAYQDFLDRLRGSRDRPIGPKLGRLIMQDDLMKIYDYFLNTPNLNIETLIPNSAYRFAKENTGLARTATVLRSKDGEFKLMVETKSKLKNGTKKSLVKKGANKKGKPAWRVDGEEVEYFNLVVYLEEEDEATSLEELQKEVDISQALSSEWVSVNEWGTLYFNQNFKKMNIYAPKADRDLEDLLESKSVILSSQQKNDLIADLLRGVKLFHDDNKVHQDLKPKNILVYALSTGGYKAKLTDYGTVQNHDDKNQTALATMGYQSPEIEHAQANLDSEYYEYYADQTYFCYAPLVKDWYMNHNHELSDTDQVAFQHPHRANDMWAIGIIIYQIKYGKRPSYAELEGKISEDPLLKGLLTPDRASRFDIDKALSVHAECIQEQEATLKKQFKM